MIDKRKRGLSAVVTTLVIILLSFVAIGIVWVVVRNVVGDATTEISFDRFSLNLGISNAYIEGSEVKVIVRRSAGAGNLSGVYFIFHNGTSSSNVKRNIALKELEENTFIFSSSEVGGVDNVELVSVSPISSNVGTEVIGGITDTAEISSSSSGGGSVPPSGGPSCGDGICQSGENAQSCPQDCSIPPSCNGVWESGSEDSGVQCDGGTRCLAGCTCPIGFVGDGLGGCVSEPSLSTGIVDSVWPSGSAKYFDSSALPKDSAQIVAYIGKYANFSGTGGETRCLKISYAEHLSDPAYNKSYMRLELPSTIVPGDVYEVWTSSTCGA